MPGIYRVQTIKNQLFKIFDVLCLLNLHIYFLTIIKSKYEVNKMTEKYWPKCSNQVEISLSLNN